MCLLFSLRRAFEGALRNSDLRSPAADVRLRQLLSLHTVQLGYRFAFLGLAHSRLLRGGELLLFQRLEITVLDDALGFAAIDNGVGLPRIVRLAFDERDGPADQAFTACTKRFQRFCSRSLMLWISCACLSIAAPSFSLKLCISSWCSVRM